MDLNKWLNEVKIEEIPDSYKDLAHAIGIEALLKLSEILGGTTTYVPKLDCLVQATRDRLIIEDYNKGMKPKELAIKYGLTDVWVRQIIDKYILERDQLVLFDKVV
jgi:Mor family transcriptional regulator